LYKKYWHEKLQLPVSSERNKEQRMTNKSTYGIELLTVKYVSELGESRPLAALFSTPLRGVSQRR